MQTWMGDMDVLVLGHIACACGWIVCRGDGDKEKTKMSIKKTNKKNTYLANGGCERAEHCMQTCWCADAEDCKEEKKNAKKKRKKNLLNINLGCRWWGGGHGHADVLHVDADRLAGECKESKK